MRSKGYIQHHFSIWGPEFRKEYVKKVHVCHTAKKWLLTFLQLLIVLKLFLSFPLEGLLIPFAELISHDHSLFLTDQIAFAPVLGPSLQIAVLAFGGRSSSSKSFRHAC